MEEELKKLFIEIVKFSKDVSPEIWAILIRQQIISGILGTAFFLVFFISSLFVFPGQTSKDWGESVPTPKAIIFIAVAGIAFLTFIIMMADASILKILNPAYYALMALKP